MKIKTSELTGAALDWAVAKCEDLQPLHHYTFAKGHHIVPHPWYEGYDFGFAPSTDWSQGGPIIDLMFSDEYGLRLRHDEEKKGGWASLRTRNGRWFGRTVLIAAMRCYVASKLGDEVEIPEELKP